MLLLALTISTMVFVSCSDDDGGGTTPDPTPGITVTSPNGNEVIQRNQPVWIHFDKNIEGDLAVYLYKGGDSLMVIEAALALDSLQWAVSEAAIVEGIDYQIKIVSKEDPSVYDFSDANFIIADPGEYIIVTSSNGGDIWLKGETKYINWVDNIAENVNIFLFKNGIAVADLFNAPQASSGVKSWLIPDDGTIVDGADYTIQIVKDGDPTVFGESEHFFCIADDRDDQNVIGDWDVLFSKQPEPNNFYFHPDGTITADSSGTSSGEGTWEMVGNGIKILASDDSAYLLGIVDGNTIDGHMLTEDGDIADWDAMRVLPDLITPNGGEVWMHGTTQTIEWDPDIAGNVVISLADDSGIIQNIATVLGSDSTYTWTVPASIEPGVKYYIRVAKEVNGEALDQSDWYFCIANTESPDILGLWDNIYANKKGPFTMEYLAGGTFIFNQGGGDLTGTWDLTGNGIRCNFDAYPNSYLIGNFSNDKVTGYLYDGSPTAVFGWDGQRLLDILTPNGGELFEMDDVVNITWNETLTASEINVDLYENDVFVENLGTVNINTYTSFNWTIPIDIVTSTKYKLRLTSTTSDIYDECDDYFIINGVAPTAIEDENFEDGAADNWTPVIGDWFVADSLYHLTFDSLVVNTSVFDSELTGNYVIEAKLKTTSVQEWFYGFYLNGDNSTLNAAGQWYDHVMISILPSGSIGFWVMVDGSETGGWYTCPEVNTGLDVWNNLKVIVDNYKNEYHVYVNDQYFITFNDSSLNSGKVGLTFCDNTTSGAGAVDYVKISPINKIDMSNVKINRISDFPRGSSKK